MRPNVYAAVCGFALLGTMACQFDESIITPSSKRMIVHSVLDPDAQSIRVLLEEIRVGPADGDGPIEISGGVPISNARVVIYGPAGDSAIGVEDLFNNGRKGIYYFNNAAHTGTLSNTLPIVRGGHYELRVTAAGRPPLYASTVVPSTAPMATDSIQFNRDRDTLRISWPAATLQARYAVWVAAGEGARRSFVNGTSVILTELKPNSSWDFSDYDYGSYWFQVASRQRAMVTAVDANYYDYYRSETNGLTGTGLINRVEGGIGLFGASVNIRSLFVRTVTTQDEPVEGLFERTDSDTATTPRWIDVFVTIHNQYGDIQLEGASGEDSTVVDGRIAGSYVPGIADDVRLSLNPGSFSGHLFGADSIVGTVQRFDGSFSGRLVYRKRRAIP